MGEHNKHTQCMHEENQMSARHPQIKNFNFRTLQNYTTLVVHFTLLSLTAPTGEAENGVCSNSCHAEERVWRRTHQGWSVRHGRSEFNPSGTNGQLAGVFDGVCLLSVQDDVCFQGYLRHMSSCCSPPPLSAAELELQKIKVTEVNFYDWWWPIVTFFSFFFLFIRIWYPNIVHLLISDTEINQHF